MVRLRSLLQAHQDSLKVCSDRIHDNKGHQQLIESKLLTDEKFVTDQQSQIDSLTDSILTELKTRNIRLDSSEAFEQISNSVVAAQSKLDYL